MYALVHKCSLVLAKCVSALIHLLLSPPPTSPNFLFTFCLHYFSLVMDDHASYCKVWMKISRNANSMREKITHVKRSLTEWINKRIWNIKKNNNPVQVNANWVSISRTRWHPSNAHTHTESNQIVKQYICANKIDRLKIIKIRRFTCAHIIVNNFENGTSSSVFEYEWDTHTTNYETTTPLSIWVSVFGCLQTNECLNWDAVFFRQQNCEKNDPNYKHMPNSVICGSTIEDQFS